MGIIDKKNIKNFKKMFLKKIQKKRRIVLEKI